MCQTPVELSIGGNWSGSLGSYVALGGFMSMIQGTDKLEVSDELTCPSLEMLPMGAMPPLPWTAHLYEC